MQRKISCQSDTAHPDAQLERALVRERSGWVPPCTISQCAHISVFQNRTISYRGQIMMPRQISCQSDTAHPDAQLERALVRERSGWVPPCTISQCAHISVFQNRTICYRGQIVRKSVV